MMGRRLTWLSDFFWQVAVVAAVPVIIGLAVVVGDPTKFVKSGGPEDHACGGASCQICMAYRRTHSPPWAVAPRATEAAKVTVAHRPGHRRHRAASGEHQARVDN